MPTLLEQPVAIKRMPVAAREQARAVEDPTRAKVPDLPYRQNMTADQMTEALKKAGHDGPSRPSGTTSGRSRTPA